MNENSTNAQNDMLSELMRTFKDGSREVEDVSVFARQILEQALYLQRYSPENENITSFVQQLRKIAG